ncbi:SPOR domain-containing protein [Vibrio fluvialis]|nr:SPOR domain-containing protein [Vibrio fluvialis]
MNKLLKSILLVTLVISSSLSYSKSIQSSDSLGLFVSVGEKCPFDSQELREKVIGEFVKARVNPTDDTALFLNVDISCLQLKNGSGYVNGYSVDADIRFGTSLHSGEQLVERFSRGTMMTGSDSADSELFYFNVIKERVSDVLVDYLKELSFNTQSDDKVYILQLMALKEKDNANNVVADLKGRGYNALSIEKNGFYQILVLTDQGFDEAQRLAEELDRITGSKSKIFKDDPSFN